MASSSKEGSIFSDLWRRILTAPATPRWAIAVATYLLILAVTANHLASPQVSGLEVGKVATRSFVAQYSSIYIDTTATEQVRNQAAQEVPAVYSIDTDVNEAIITDLANFFLAVGDNVTKVNNGAGGAGNSQQVKEALLTAASNNLRKLLDSALHIQRYYVEAVTDEMLRQLLATDQQSRDTIREIVDQAIRERIVGIIYESDLPKAVDSLRTSVLEKADTAGLTPDQGQIAAVLAGYFIRPNAALDQTATDIARQQARDATPPVQKEVRQGQVFLREGEIISQESMDILSALGMKESRGNENAWLTVSLFGVILLSAFVFCALYLPSPNLPHLADMRYFLCFFQ